VNGARRYFVAAVLLYLAFDLCDAVLPGAFTFDPDSSVEVTAHRVGHGGPAPSLRSPQVARVKTHDDVERPAIIRPSLIPATRHHVPLKHHLQTALSDPPSGTEDH